MAVGTITSFDVSVAFDDHHFRIADWKRGCNQLRNSNRTFESDEPTTARFNFDKYRWVTVSEVEFYCYKEITLNSPWLHFKWTSVYCTVRLFIITTVKIQIKWLKFFKLIQFHVKCENLRQIKMIYSNQENIIINNLFKVPIHSHLSVSREKNISRRATEKKPKWLNLSPHSFVRQKRVYPRRQMIYIEKMGKCQDFIYSGDTVLYTTELSL